MHPTRAARLGIQPVEKEKEQASDASKRLLEVNELLDSAIWKNCKSRLREGYINLLKLCPPNDDMQRYRLCEALNVLDLVENQLRLAHSDAEIDLQKATEADFRSKPRFFRRR